jgi:hypothetical protein
MKTEFQGSQGLSSASVSARLPPNTAVKVAPFGRWTLRDKALRSAPYLQRWASYAMICPHSTCDIKIMPTLINWPLHLRNVALVLFALLLNAVTCNVNAQGDVVRVTIGRETLTLPVPAHYVSTDGLPKLQAIVEAATPTTHRLLFALYPKKDVDAWRNDQSLQGDRYFLIQTEKQSEPHSLSQAEFARLKLALRQRVAERIVGNDAGANKQRIEHQRELDANLPALRKQLSLPPMTMQIGETVILGIADDQPTSLSTASATKLAAASEGRTLDALMVSVSTVLLAKGKLVNIYGYSRYQRPDDLRWLQDESKALVEQFSSANR